MEALSQKDKGMKHDLDDPPPRLTWEGRYWYFANRYAEWCMGYARAIGFLALLLYAGASQAHEHAGVNYSNWTNQADKGCCNNQDCRPAKEDEVRYSPVVAVKIENTWCPVKPEHYLKKGNAPDWSSAHMCIQMLYADEYGATVPPVDPCSRLLCFQPHPMN